MSTMASTVSWNTLTTVLLPTPINSSGKMPLGQYILLNHGNHQRNVCVDFEYMRVPFHMEVDIEAIIVDLAIQGMVVC